jgi:serine/threonine protein kinase
MVLSGKYRLLAPIGEGGMGIVWRAEDLRLGAPVALKLIHQHGVNNAEMLARFEAEAEIAAQLRSPHVVQVFDAGVDQETGWPFIAMEYLQGASLRERLARERVLTPAALVELVSQVARALTRAHELGIIHRDLKPANVFLLRDHDRDVVKVLDFGIAKRTQGLRVGPTMTGDLLGTPTYMSPEQIVSSKDVDYRTDLWSLAVIACECLTGKLPFDCDNLPGLALMICQGQPTLPSKLGRVPAGFDAWFLRATQARAADRFASAAELAEELRRVCQEESVRRLAPQRESEGLPSLSERVDLRVAPSVGPTTTPVPRPVDPALLRQRRFRRLALAALAALLVAATFALFPGTHEPTTTIAAAEPARVPDPEPHVADPAQKPLQERKAGAEAQPAATNGAGGAAGAPNVKVHVEAPRPRPPVKRPPVQKPKPASGEDADNWGF